MVICLKCSQSGGEKARMNEKIKIQTETENVIEQLTVRKKQKQHKIPWKYGPAVSFTLFKTRDR